MREHYRAFNPPTNSPGARLRALLARDIARAGGHGSPSSAAVWFSPARVRELLFGVMPTPFDWERPGERMSVEAVAHSHVRDVLMTLIGSDSALPELTPGPFASDDRRQGRFWLWRGSDARGREPAPLCEGGPAPPGLGKSREQLLAGILEEQRQLVRQPVKGGPSVAQEQLQKMIGVRPPG